MGRLERDGVITGYRAVVDPQAIGFPLAAVVRVRPFARQIHKIPELAERTPEVVECERITGEDCFLLRLHVRAIDDLEEVLDNFTPFGQTTTSIVHSSPVPRRSLPLGRRGVRGRRSTRRWFVGRSGALPSMMQSASRAQPARRITACSPRGHRSATGPGAPLANHDRGCTIASA